MQVVQAGAESAQYPGASIAAQVMGALTMSAGLGVVGYGQLGSATYVVVRNFVPGVSQVGVVQSLQVSFSIQVPSVRGAQITGSPTRSAGWGMVGVPLETYFRMENVTPGTLQVGVVQVLQTSGPSVHPVPSWLAQTVGDPTMSAGFGVVGGQGPL